MKTCCQLSWCKRKPIYFLTAFDQFLHYICGTQSRLLHLLHSHHCVIYCILSIKRGIHCFCRRLRKHGGVFGNMVQSLCHFTHNLRNISYLHFLLVIAMHELINILLHLVHVLVNGTSNHMHVVESTPRLFC